MGYSKNPIAWVAVLALIVFAGYRFVVDVPAGDGPIVAIGVGLAAVIVVVLLTVLNRSAASQLASVSALRPHSLVKPVIPSTPAIQINKRFARTQGLTAKGGMIAQAATFDPESIIVWTGTRQPKVHVSVPSSIIRGMAVQKLAEGLRTYNAIAFQVDADRGILIAIKDKDEALRPAVLQIADAIGLDHRAVVFS